MQQPKYVVIDQLAGAGRRFSGMWYIAGVCRRGSLCFYYLYGDGRWRPRAIDKGRHCYCDTREEAFARLRRFDPDAEVLHDFPEDP